MQREAQEVPPLSLSHVLCVCVFLAVKMESTLSLESEMLQQKFAELVLCAGDLPSTLYFSHVILPKQN